MESNPAPAGRRELTSWKEVADYLGVTVRTAQKWEHERRLPVKRLPGKGRGRIIVAVADLEEWKHSGEGAAVEEPPSGVWRRVRVWALAAVLVVIGSGLAAWRLSGLRQDPEAFHIEHGSLVVTDARGKELWRRSFDPPLLAEHYDKSAAQGRRRFWSGDLDGDGGKEILFVHERDLGETSALICYSADGAERWRFRPGRNVATRKEKFQNKFAVADFAVAPLGEAGAPAVVAAGTQNPYYPTQVALLSGTGNVLSEYWHSGNLYRVAVLGSMIYLGGVSNGYKAATLIALDRDHFQGASVETHPDYQLLDMPAAREVARILFPPTCISRTFEPYNAVNDLTAGADEILVLTGERHGPANPTVLYHFAPDLSLTEAGVSDGFRRIHAELRAAGQLDHDFAPAEDAALGKGVRRIASSRPR